MLTAADLVHSKPREASILRQELSRCGYDHASQTRRWKENEEVRRIFLSTGAPSSST